VQDLGSEDRVLPAETLECLFGLSFGKVPDLVEHPADRLETLGSEAIEIKPRLVALHRLLGARHTRWRAPSSSRVSGGRRPRDPPCGTRRRASLPGAGGRGR